EPGPGRGKLRECLVGGQGVPGLCAWAALDHRFVAASGHLTPPPWFFRLPHIAPVVAAFAGRELALRPCLAGATLGRHGTFRVRGRGRVAGPRVASVETEVAMDRERQIRERAHEIWESEGRPNGREHEHWARAQA